MSFNSKFFSGFARGYSNLDIHRLNKSRFAITSVRIEITLSIPVEFNTPL